MIWNDFWRKWKNKSAKAGLHLNIKTKIMTTEETHNFNTDNEDTNIVKVLLTLIQSSIQMETAAKKSRDSRDSKGQQGKN